MRRTTRLSLLLMICAGLMTDSPGVLAQKDGKGKQGQTAGRQKSGKGEGKKGGGRDVARLGVRGDGGPDRGGVRPGSGPKGANENRGSADSSSGRGGGRPKSGGGGGRGPAGSLSNREATGLGGGFGNRGGGRPAGGPGGPGGGPSGGFDFSQSDARGSIRARPPVGDSRFSNSEAFSRSPADRLRGLQTQPIRSDRRTYAHKTSFRFTPGKRERITVDLPAQYVQIDSNRDGQLGLYEWPRSGWSQFMKLDTNNDGLLTPRELLQANGN